MSTTTSLSRAFTSRKARGHEHSASNSSVSKVSRSLTSAKASKNIRSQISAPMQLVHTTNMLSYNAPDLPRSSRSNSTNSSKHSDDGIDTAHSTPPTSPDMPQEELHHVMEPNHLTSYFAQQKNKAITGKGVQAPKRSASHVKKTSFDALIPQQLPMARMSKDSEHTVASKTSGTFSRTPSTSTTATSISRSSTQRSQKPVMAPLQTDAAITAAPPRPGNAMHPFGQELAQVTELAEEFSSKGQGRVIDEDEEFLESRGLMRFSANEYMMEIQSLALQFLPQLPLNVKATTQVWI